MPQLLTQSKQEPLESVFLDVVGEGVVGEEVVFALLPKIAIIQSSSSIASWRWLGDSS